jgi:hypothetical protein
MGNKRKNGGRRNGFKPGLFIKRSVFYPLTRKWEKHNNEPMQCIGFSIGSRRQSYTYPLTSVGIEAKTSLDGCLLSMCYTYPLTSVGIEAVINVHWPIFAD